MSGTALRGVRVVDLGRLMPSSIATAELASLGAEVVKVEFPPFGDYLRINPPLVEGRGDMHLAINQGKRSICLDPRTSEGQQILDRLIAGSDVVVELSRPGGGSSLGFDRERFRRLNPSIVHCSITGFGHSGPYSHLGAHGLSADAAAGLLPIERHGTRWMVPDTYISVGPRASGLYAAIAILGALFEARATGEGAFLDVSQWDSAVAWNYRNLTLMANGAGLTPGYSHLGPKYDLYETRDSRQILLCVPEPKLWRAFCNAAGRPDLLDRASDAAIEYVDDQGLRDELRREFLSRTQSEWLELGLAHGFPIAPVLPVDDLATNEHVIEREMLVSRPHPLGGEVKLPGSPIKDGSTHVLTPAPELGEHTHEVLRSLGYGEAEIDDLVDRSIVRSAAS
jgi:formyl-CoA transferase